MKRTAPMLTLVFAVLLGAVVSYVFFSLRARIGAPDAPDAPEPPCREGIPLHGLLVREEEPLVSLLSHTRLIVEEGQRVGALDALGCAYSSEEELRKAGELDRLLSALRAAASPLPAHAARLSLARALARQDMAALSLTARSVHYAMLRNGAEDARRHEARLLEEIEAFRSFEQNGAELLTAPAPGFFSARCDGWETLTADELAALSPDALFRLMAEEREPPHAYGRLITGSEWHLAAPMNAGDAARLREGMTVSLAFPALSRSVSARVLSVGAATDGLCVSVFSSREALSELLTLRRTEVRLIIPTDQSPQ